MPTVKVASGTVTVRLADGEADIVDVKLVDPPLIAIAIVYSFNKPLKHKVRSKTHLRRCK